MWQPIATAPKDGTRFIAYVPIEDHRLVLAFITRDGLILDEYAKPMIYAPTLWHPLPEHPAQQTDGEVYDALSAYHQVQTN
jgi:hypothetical protein